MSPERNPPVAGAPEVYAYIKRRILIQLRPGSEPTLGQVLAWLAEVESQFGPGIEDMLVDLIRLESRPVGPSVVNNNSVVLNNSTVGGNLTLNNESRTGVSLAGWEKVVAVVAGMTLLAALLVRAFLPGEIGDQQFIIFRLFMALAAAVLVGLLTGFVTVKLSLGKSMVVRAGGAVAAFVIVYFALPAIPVVGQPPAPAITTGPTN